MMELWAGAECSVIRVGDRQVDQLALTGHRDRQGDLELVASLGARAVRFPVLWERTAPDGLFAADFRFADDGLARCLHLGLRPIVGLVHHGSGPSTTSLTADSFVRGLAAYARRVAERYPFVKDWTPVNEPGTTARFSGLYGHWYPHERSARAFVKALLVEVLATREAMRTIREVIPAARLVQTEDLGTVYATPRLAYQADHENERRFLGYDLLSGRVDRSHPLRSWLEREGASRDVLDDLVASPCTPDLLGVNYYLTSDRFLDERVSRYPAEVRGGNTKDVYADVEAVRVRAGGICGHAELLRVVWERYRLPMALTEVHLGCTSEEQVRWLFEAWQGAEAARRGGVDVRAVTVWSAFGAKDWDSLCTEGRGTYEPGTFDVRAGVVRPTALARVAAELAASGTTTHPLASQPGWWRRRERLLYPAVGDAVGDAAPVPWREHVPPVLVVGARGTLGSAVLRTLRRRRVPVVGLTRGELDATDLPAVERALATHRPWAVINAAGDVRVDAAEADPSRCIRENLTVATTLAEACARAGVKLVTYSSDLVFDGAKGAPYVESDVTAPLSVYGTAKAVSETAVLARCPDALVVRTAAFFGPWDPWNFVTVTLADLRAGRSVHPARDRRVSPTYVPDLADATLTLAVDGASGIHHVANTGSVSWAELAFLAAEAAGEDRGRILPRDGCDVGWVARRPADVTLASERAGVMPSLESALARYVTEIACRDAGSKTGTTGR